MPTAVDVSSTVGLFAVGILTANILLGLLISTGYNPQRRWPRRRIKLFTLHNWTGYIALGVAVLHPAIILLSSTAGLLDALAPIGSPQQPFVNTLGAIALYLVAFAVITSYFRHVFGFQRWKQLHYTTYAAAAVFFVHGILPPPVHLRCRRSCRARRRGRRFVPRLACRKGKLQGGVRTGTNDRVCTAAKDGETALSDRRVRARLWRVGSAHGAVVRKPAVRVPAAQRTRRGGADLQRVVRAQQQRIPRRRSAEIHEPVARLRDHVREGSRVAPVMLTHEPRVKAAALWIPGFYLETMAPEVDPINFMSHMTIPVLQLSGRYDYNFPDETSSLPFFNMLGTPVERKRRVVYDTGHNLPTNEAIRETLDWFDKYLGQPQ